MRGNGEEQSPAAVFARLGSQGRWDELASALAAALDDSEARADAEACLQDLLSRGEIRGLYGGLTAGGERAGQARPLVLSLFEADAGVRLWDRPSFELETLRPAVTECGDRVDLQLWYSAITAEHYLMQLDLSAFAVAQAALQGAEAGDGRYFARVSRGRLLRMLAIGSLIAGAGGNAEEVASLRERAVAEFVAVGCAEEILATDTILGLARAMVQREDAAECAAALEELTRQARQMGTDRAANVVLAAAWVSLLAWDPNGVRAALGEIDTVTTGLAPVLADMRDMLVACVQIVEEGSGGSIASELPDLVARTSRRSLLVGGVAIFLAGLLLDVGLWELAGEVVPDEILGAPLPAVSHLDAATVRARLRVLREPCEEAVAAFESTVESGARFGSERSLAVSLLRGARDCERVGLVDAAGRLRARGLAGLPEAGRRTARESYYATPSTAVHAAPGRSSADLRSGELLVLGPDVRVRRFGREIRPRSTNAKFLALLAGERRAVTTEWMVESLWPNVAPDVGRERLNSLVYRLRCLLDLDSDELVLRERHGLELDPGTTWRVDARDFADALGGDTEERLRCLDLYRDGYCRRQFAYDDEIAATRSRFEGLWIRLVGSLLADGALSRDEVLARATRLRIDMERVPGF